MFDIYSENMFIFINFCVLYYSVYLKFSKHAFERIDNLIINMTIIGVSFCIISFIYNNYVIVETAHIILAFQILLGSILYTNDSLSIVFLVILLYVFILRYKYRRCPFYVFFPHINDNILLTSYNFNTMCFILSLCIIISKKLYIN